MKKQTHFQPIRPDHENRIKGQPRPPRKKRPSQKRSARSNGRRKTRKKNKRPSTNRHASSGRYVRPDRKKKNRRNSSSTYRSDRKRRDQSSGSKSRKGTMSNRPLPRPSARRTTFLGQMRMRKQIRRKQFLFGILGAVFVFIFAIWVSRTFFTSKPDEIPETRQAINEHIVHDIVISDTKGRPLSTAEKKDDLKLLIEAMKIVPESESPGLKDGTFDKAAKKALTNSSQSSNDEAFFEQVKNLVASAKRPGCQLMDQAAYKMARANIGYGVYQKDSPYAKALLDPRVVDRYERMVPMKEEVQPSFPYLKWLGNNAVIQGLSFNSAATERDKDKIGELFSQGAKAEKIIIDLRGCQGTSISYGMDAVLKHFASGSFSSTSNIYFPLGFNEYISYLSSKEEVDHVDLEDDKEEISSQTPEALRKKLKDMSYKKRLTCSFVGRNPKVSSDQVYILVDKTTQNAAETFADFCQSNGLGRVFGQRTFGNAWDVPPLILTLPHSGLLVSMDISCQSTLDGKSLQSESGVLPAYSLQGEDLMSALLYWEDSEEQQTKE